MEIATELKSPPVQPLHIELTRLARQHNGIRQAEVDAMKRLIASGHYQINLDQLADRLLDQF